MREIRVASLDRVRISRDPGDTGADTVGFTGHAAVFDTPVVIGGMRWGFVEQIEPGAFVSVLEDDVRFLHNHDPNLLFARTTNGTLRLAEDRVGLDVGADMAPTQLTRDVSVLLDRGDIDQMSFAFTVAEDRWETLADDHPQWPGMELRTIVKILTLYDVSTVTYAAYTTTDAGLRYLPMGEAEVRAIVGTRPTDERARVVLERQRQRHRLQRARYGIRES